MNFIPLKVQPRKVLVLAALVLSLSTQAQTVLDQYVEEGLKSNLVLQEKSLTLQQAEQSLQIARSYFLPSVNLLADYTSGEGGRSIAVPIGDLLNPVYASLNQLTQSDRFPQVENVNQNFFPKNFYDARVRTSLPVVNTDLYVNKTIRAQQIVLRQYEVDAYKRQLVLDIKTAYFQYLAAESAVHIHESALTLVHRNVEVNESLLKNGKNLPATVLRSRSEEERVAADLNSARNSVTNARRYFNFLLNKELDTPVNAQYELSGTILQDTTTLSVNRREEVRMLLQAKEINQSSLRLNRLSRLPKINAFLDLGSQASDWHYNNDSRYYLVGVQFSLPLFQGFRTNMNIRQNKLDIQRNELSLKNTTQQLQMAAQIAQSDLQTAQQNLRAAEQQLKSAQSYFNLLDKGYQQGVYSLIEFLDARNQLTASQLQQNLRQFDVLTATARLERETSSYALQP